MYRVRSAGWVWHWLELADWNRLGPRPEQLTADTETVKRSRVRGVFRRDGYYFKLELPECGNPFSFWRAVLFPRARREFFTAWRLRRAGVTVTEPVGFGQSLTCSMLITRAWPEAESVNDYWERCFGRGTDDPAAFLEEWSAFVRTVLDSGFFHPDFHNGNLLRRASDGAFALVDVYGVRRSRFGGRRHREAMARIAGEFRERLDRPALLALLKRCGVAEPEDFYGRLLRREAARIEHEWPRRRRQLAEEYPKFVTPGEVSGRRVLLHLDGARRPLVEAGRLAAECDALEPGEERARVWRERDLRWTLHRIPHRRVAAWEPERGVLYLEKCSESSEPPPESGWRERLELAGWNPAELQWVRDRFGRFAVTGRE